MAALVFCLCFLVWAFCGILGAIIGGQKDQAGLGATLGFFFGPFGLLIIAVMAPVDRRRFDDHRDRTDWDMEPRPEWPKGDLPEALPADDPPRPNRQEEPLAFLSQKKRRLR